MRPSLRDILVSFYPFPHSFVAGFPLHAPHHQASVSAARTNGCRCDSKKLQHLGADQPGTFSFNEQGFNYKPGESATALSIVLVQETPRKYFMGRAGYYVWCAPMIK